MGLFKHSYILACLFLYGLALTPTYAAEHAPKNESEDSSNEAKNESLEQEPKAEETEEEKREKTISEIVGKHTEDLNEAKKDKLTEDQEKDLKGALDALLDPKGELEKLDPLVLEQGLKLLQDKLAAAEGEEKTEAQAAVDRGNEQIKKIAEAKKTLANLMKVAEAYAAPLKKFSANPKQAINDAARSLGESIAKQSNSQAAPKSADKAGWGGAVGASVGAVLGGSMFGMGGAVVGGLMGHAAGSYVDTQAQQAGGYANYASHVFSGNYSSNASIIEAPNSRMMASSPSPKTEASAVIAAGTFELDSRPASSNGAAVSIGATPAANTAGFPANPSSDLRYNLETAVLQAGERGLGRTPTENFASGSTSEKTASPTTSALSPPESVTPVEANFRERVLEVMAGMPQAGEGVEPKEFEPRATPEKSANVNTPAIVIPATRAAVGGVAPAVAEAEDTAASIAAAKLPEPVARSVASEVPTAQTEDKAANPTPRTDGGNIYAVKKASGETKAVIASESYAAPSNPTGSAEPEAATETKPVVASVPESSLEATLNYTQNAVESLAVLMKKDPERGIASMTASTVAPVPGKLTIAGLTNPQVSEATLKAFQDALPKSFAATISTSASSMDSSLLGLLQKNNGEIAQRGISSIPAKTKLPREPSLNSIVKDAPKGDIFSKFFAGQI